MKFNWNIRKSENNQQQIQKDNSNFKLNTSIDLFTHLNYQLIYHQHKTNKQIFNLNQNLNKKSIIYVFNSSNLYKFNLLSIIQYCLILSLFISPVICINSSNHHENHLYSTIYQEYKICRDNEELYKQGLENSTIFDSKNYCRPYFDNYLCWHNAKLDETLILNCSEAYSNSTGNNITRKCLNNGEWTNADYSQCGTSKNPTIELDYLEHVHNNVWKNVNFSYPVYYDQLFKCIDKDLYNDFKEKVKKSNYCNATFDGWTCWPRTEANETAFTDCPVHSKAAGYTGFKQCLEDGSWFRHPSTNRTWSDYSQCHDWDDLNWRNMINNFYLIGYTISLIAMLISLYIFFSFRSLKCSRILVHKNLFISFIIGNVHWIYVYLGIFKQVDVLQNNSIFCRIIFSSTKYFTHTNYTWTLCEGLYLYYKVVFGFVNEKQIIFYLMIIGWISPLIYYLPYIVLRILSSSTEDSIRCWVDDSIGYELIVQYPIFFVILLNIFFLIGIIRVLLSKLNPGVDNHHKKTIKAFFFLFPLLSLQYVITLNRPSDGSVYERFYDGILCLAASLQGLFVSLIYCFFNNEVQSLLKKEYATFKYKFCGDRNKKNKRLNTNFHTTTEEVTLFE